MAFILLLLFPTVKWRASFKRNLKKGPDLKSVFFLGTQE